MPPYTKQIGPIDTDLKNFKWYHLLPKFQLPKCQAHIDAFFKTMFERQEVWHRRHVLKQDFPWTEDPILREYKFTNVYRQLDRSSQWLINNVLTTPNQTKLNLVWQIIAYRLFNKPDAFEWGVYLPTYAQYHDTFNQDEFAEQMARYAAKPGDKPGANPFTSSFYINCTNCDGLKKLDCYTRRELPRIHKMVPGILEAIRIAEKLNDPHHLIKALTQLPRVSHFNAHEFYQDFCYHRTYKPKDEQALTRFTQMDYTNVGPGASVGLRLLYPNAQNKAAQEERLRELHAMAVEKLAEYGQFKYAHWNRYKGIHHYMPIPNITLHQIEMFLCEFAKYKKMEWGIGRQRSKYIPK